MASRLEKIAIALAITGGLFTIAYVQAPPRPQRAKPAAGSKAGIEAYGKIIKRIRPEAQNQLYIIGQTHYAPSGNAPSPHFYQAQLEVFRIAELLKKSGSELVLTESRYSNEDHTQEDAKNRRVFVNGLTSEEHARLFGDDSTLVQFIARGRVRPSELLVYCGINVQGCESKELHEMTIRSMRTAFKNRPDLERIASSALTGKLPEGTEPVSSETMTLLRVAYDLGNGRSAEILYRAPSVIDRELAAKRITRKNATIIIGNGHLPGMIKYADQNSAEFTVNGESSVAKFTKPLKLKEKGYGVTFIEPHTVRTIMNLGQFDYLVPK